MRFSDYDDRVPEWELGLPTSDELPPLSQPLITPELASAFSISPEPYRTAGDVARASEITFSGLRGQYSSKLVNNYNSFDNSRSAEFDVEEIDADRNDSRKAETIKRQRLVWTPQLHKRFVDVVAHLGIKNAVPKTIMQLMNVEGLTRENVASHLQKYRLYLKRMQGGGASEANDHLFESTPVPPSLKESSVRSGSGSGSGNVSGHVPMHYGAQMVPMPMPMPLPVYGQMSGYPGFEYGMMQQKDWSGNKFDAVNSYQRIPQCDK